VSRVIEGKPAGIPVWFLIVVLCPIVGVLLFAVSWYVQLSSPIATVEPVRIRVMIGNTTGYLVIADTEEFQRKGYELVREGDIGVLFVFKDLPRTVCFHNPFNYSIYVYIVEGGLWLKAVPTAVLRPQSRWCTLLLENEFVLESTHLWKDPYVFIVRL
jgi:uncharacterized membrane protein (UPF0127 family)